MGVAVYEQAPDAETLLLNDAAPAAVSDDQADEEAEVALSTVDSEFGRTTDPVRMYMREMGATELLTRAGEIEIAKRIEDGLHEMIQAIAACPATVSAILASAEQVEAGELRIDELVDGLNEDTRAEDETVGVGSRLPPTSTRTRDERRRQTTATTTIGAADSTQANEARLKQLTSDCLAIFARVRELFDQMPRRRRAATAARRRLRTRARRDPARTGDDSLHGANHRPAVRRRAATGRAGARDRAPHFADRRRSVRHAAREVRRVVSGSRDRSRLDRTRGGGVDARTARRSNAVCRRFRPNSKS